MSSTPVQRDQFRISAKGITHTPTGATYTPHPGAPHSGIMNLGQLGNVLANGEDYRPHEVQTMMELLWAEYVDANPRHFEVHDRMSRAAGTRPRWRVIPGAQQPRVMRGGVPLFHCPTSVPPKIGTTQVVS